MDGLDPATHALFSTAMFAWMDGSSQVKPVHDDAGVPLSQSRAQSLPGFGEGGAKRRVGCLPFIVAAEPAPDGRGGAGCYPQR
jgi:hypothetical protein